MLIGGVIAVVSMLIAGYLYFLLERKKKEEKKEKEVYKTKDKKETGIRTVKRTVIPENSEKRKPGMLLFLHGSGLCYSITILL